MSIQPTEDGGSGNEYPQIIHILREQKEQLEFAAELSGVGYWRFDLINNSLFWSDQVHRIHGTDPGHFIPEVDAAINFYHEDDRAIIRAHVEHAIKTGSGYEQVARLYRADGEVRNVHTLATTRQDANGQTITLFGVFRDITEEKRKEAALRQTLEELSRSNEELNRFSYVCSHDMKEPVRMIESMVQLVTDPAFEGTEEQRFGLLKRIETNTSRLRAIIDSLLAYSRIDAKVEFKPTDLGEIAREAAKTFSERSEGKNANIEIGELPVIMAAPVHFYQLLQNLVGNALKFSDKPNPHVKVFAEQNPDGLNICVGDDGPGVPEEAREEIFEMFSRLKRRDEVEGTGLGLSIAKRIVGQYGGTITCRNSVLGGACFRIVLPATIAGGDD